jgi:gamma-D-glutamyl-L-lysine dipeptidyl-peptidase
MLEPIRASLAEITQKYADTRTHHCRIMATEMADERCILTGTVLDQQTFEAVTSELWHHFPSLPFDTSQVKILRQTAVRYLTVKTTVTGLHAEPSFRSEMASQLLNGQSVECLMQQESWVYVRQPDGYLGWVYEPYLTATAAAPATHVICAPISLLRAGPDLTAEITGRSLAGTRVAASESHGGCSHIAFAGGAEGWVMQDELRALDAIPATASARREQMVGDGRQYLDVPYLWGGCTALGIDCSGFVQLLHSLAGITILRDADMQLYGGRAVEPPFQPGDLLFFGSKRGHRTISHTGMSLGGWQMIHSSRARNGVHIDDVRATPWLRDIFVGACTYLSAGSGD